jgi:hypothetical protein
LVYHIRGTPPPPPFSRICKSCSLDIKRSTRLVALKMSERKELEVFAFDDDDGAVSLASNVPYQSAEEGDEPGPSDRASIDVFRRAMPEVESEEDVCSICLDGWSKDDPGHKTSCGHQYHLQCIMQWAQRSRECPLCFRALALEVRSLNYACSNLAIANMSSFHNEGA